MPCHTGVAPPPVAAWSGSQPGVGTQFSHEAVVIFFVMSGFIIYATTAGSGRTATDYTIARASRIDSVALPAVILSVGMALLADRSAFVDVQALNTWVAPTLSGAISSLLFLNESWSNPSTVPLNHPYWSLCYEVWYYVLFGVFWFGAGIARWIALAVVWAIHSLLRHVERPIRYGAGFSFSLYLFHRPFTQIGGHLFPNTDGSALHATVAAVGITAICAVLSYGTERTLPLWRSAMRATAIRRHPSTI